MGFITAIAKLASISMGQSNHAHQQFKHAHQGFNLKHAAGNINYREFVLIAHYRQPVVKQTHPQIKCPYFIQTDCEWANNFTSSQHVHYHNLRD